VKLKKKGQNTAPEGFSDMPRRSPAGQYYWVNEQAQVIMHNLYDTPSLWNQKNIGGDAFRGLMNLKNKIVPLKLGLSLFHALHVATIDNATGMVRATKGLFSGTVGPLEWLAEMGKATFYREAVSAPREGGKLLKILRGQTPEGEITPADRAALVVLAEGGVIPGMPEQHRMNALANFKRAVERRSVSAAWHLPWAAVDAVQGIMFEKWIPALKIASYLKDAKTALETDPTLIQDDLRRRMAFRKLAKSVDNRYGEMAYNTLFWNRWVKDIGVASTLSLGWNLGFLREYGGSGIETVQAMTRPGGLAEKVSRGELDRALFVTFYTVQSLAYGGLITYLLTGEPPEEWIDYIYPKNGEKNPDGTDQRVSTMFYAREFAAISKHMEHEGVIAGLGQTALNKASPAIGMVRDWAQGVNYFGEEIRNPDAPLYKQLEQTLRHTFKELEPISTMSMRKGAEVTPKIAALSVMGFTEAPKYAIETHTQGAIRSTFMKYFGKKRTPYERAEYSDDARKLRALYADRTKRNEYFDLLRKMEKEYGFTRTERQRMHMAIRKNEDPYPKMFARLTWQQQKRILDDMTPEERRVYLPHSNKEHLRRKYRPPEE
jgi:hypothetical protein